MGKTILVVLIFFINSKAFGKDSALKIMYQNEDSVLKILTYGMLIRFDDEQSRRAIEKNYGFERYSVAGCVVTEKLLDSVKKQNDKVYSILSKRYGIDWDKKFETEVKRLHIKEKKAIALIEKQDFFPEVMREVKKYDYPLEYLIEETADNIIKLTAFQSVYNERRFINRKFFMVSIDLKHQNLILENRKFEETVSELKFD